MLRSLLATAPLVALASAFSDTYPVVAWSSHKTSVLDRLPAAPAALGELFTHMLTHDDICSYDAVVLVEQPGLHASDLRTLSPTSGFVTQLSSSPKSVQRPYVRRSSSASESGLHDLAHLVTQRCAGRLASVVPGESDLVLEPKAKHVVNMYLPELEGTISERKAKAAESAHALLQELPKIASSLPKYLVILTGAPPSTRNAKRQLTITSISDDPLQAEVDVPVPILQQHPIPSSFSADTPESGILARYQLLTPALITSLLIALFVFLPMLVFAVSALASIQSPLRVEAPKGYSADGKKNQ